MLEIACCRAVIRKRRAVDALGLTALEDQSHHRSGKILQYIMCWRELEEEHEEHISLY